MIIVPPKGPADVNLRGGFYALMPRQAVIPAVKMGTVAYSNSGATVVSFTVPTNQTFVLTNAKLMAVTGTAADRLAMITDDLALVETDAWFVDMGSSTVGQIDISNAVSAFPGPGLSILNTWLLDMLHWPIFERYVAGKAVVALRTRGLGSSPVTPPTRFVGVVSGFFLPTSVANKIFADGGD